MTGDIVQFDPNKRLMGLLPANAVGPHAVIEIWPSDEHPGYTHYSIIIKDEQISTKKPIRQDAFAFVLQHTLDKEGVRVPLSCVEWREAATPI